LAEVLLFHHALGLTDGVVAFADELRSAGHTVHTPDLYAGRTFATVEDGVAHAKSIGFDAILDRGRDVASLLRREIVYAGMSLGVMPAEMLAMRRPGAKGALLLFGCIPLDEFGGVWPAGVPLQVDVMEDDPEGDVQFAREVAGSVPGAELFLYPGSRHLFLDSSVPEHYDEAAARLAMPRILAFLERL
jgi:dienelactone hydrolase